MSYHRARGVSPGNRYRIFYKTSRWYAVKIGGSGYVHAWSATLEGLYRRLFEKQAWEAEYEAREARIRKSAYDLNRATQHIPAIRYEDER